MQPYSNDTAEAYRASTDAIGDSIRLALTVAMLMAQMAVERRERRFAEEREAAEERARIAAERTRAERAAAEPVLRSVHQDRFWRDADPRRIGRAWQAAGEWAESDPYAAYTLEVLRENLRERFGIEAPQWTAGGPDLARIVTVANPQYQAVLDRARAAAEEAGQVSYAVLVRDLNDPYRIVEQVEARAPAGMPADAVAAREFTRWAEGSGAEQAAGREGQFVVELVENSGHSTRGAQVPAAQVRGDQVTQVLAADEAWQRALIDGTQRGSDAEMLYALTCELDRMEAEHQFRVGRRAEYAARLASEGLSAHDQARLEGNVQAIDSGLTSLNQQRADTALRLAATAAQARGEHGQHVYDAARLTDSLDEGWWQTASAQEIAGVWDHVASWAPGQAREEMRQVLREGVERHHGLLVPREATSEMVGALFGGRDMPGVATPLTEHAEALRQQALALYEEAFDTYAERIELERTEAARPRVEGEEEPYLLRVVEELAEAGTRQADALVRQAVWLEENTPEALRRIYEENSADAVTQLAAEFEAQWGRELRQEARDQLAAAVAEAAPTASTWRVVAGTGSVSPTSVTVIPGQVVGTPVEEAEVSVSATADAARRAVAGEALDGLVDAEAAQAARLTMAAFPEGPEGAVARPPQTVSKGGAGQGPARQRAAQIEM